MSLAAVVIEFCNHSQLPSPILFTCSDHGALEIDESRREIQLEGVDILANLVYFFVERRQEKTAAGIPQVQQFPPNYFLGLAAVKPPTH